MERPAVTLWEIDIHPAPGQPDLLGRAVTAEAADLGLGQFTVSAARGFLVQGDVSREQVERLSRELLADLVVERPAVGQCGPLAPRADNVGNRLSVPRRADPVPPLRGSCLLLIS